MKAGDWVKIDTQGVSLNHAYMAKAPFPAGPCQVATCSVTGDWCGVTTPDGRYLIIEARYLTVLPCHGKTVLEVSDTGLVRFQDQTWLRFSVEDGKLRMQEGQDRLPAGLRELPPQEKAAFQPGDRVKIVRRPEVRSSGLGCDLDRVYGKTGTVQGLSSADTRTYHVEVDDTRTVWYVQEPYLAPLPDAVMEQRLSRLEEAVARIEKILGRMPGPLA